MKDILVVGGSFIASELSSTLKTSYQQANVTQVTRGPLVFSKHFGDRVGQHMQDFMVKNNINVQNNKEVTSITTGSNKRKLVKFNDGSSMEVDMVLYGIGDQPNTDFLEKILLDSGNGGVSVNKFL